MKYNKLRSGTVHENEFNIALCKALQNCTAQWRSDPTLIQAEKTDVLSGRGKAGKRPDILILDPRSPPSVIECSFDAADANKDASSRLGLITKNGRREIRTSISVHIPTLFRSSASPEDELNAGAEIGFALYQKANNDIGRWPDNGFIQSSTPDLAAFLTATSLPKEEIEYAADDVASLVDEAAACLKALPKATKEQIDNRINRGSILKSLKTTMVLWLNALLTQQRLHGQGVSHAPSLDFTNDKLPSHSEQIAVWRHIQLENWRAIFDPAIEILELAGNSDLRLTGEALTNLTKAVETIELAGLGLHINVGAELFPKLSEDRKQAAAFYTQTATAELLTTLTIRQSDLKFEQWANGNLFADKSLADLACGTGTLLRAGYRRIQTIHELSGGTIESVSDLHRGAMETGLVGTDVSPIAAHLTSSSLAAIGMGEPYGDTRIGWVNVGGSKASTGSLEYFDAPEQQDWLQSIAGRSVGIDKQDNFSVHIPDSSIDWILMNPPYSRTRGGQSAFDIAGLSDSERKACQKRWGKLIKKEPANARAGMGASFLALARKKIRRGGRLGFVLPLTAAFADTWSETRRMIEREFVDITAVTVAAGQALGKDALSADTGMEEMLLIATRREKPGRQVEYAPIKCVTLNAPVTRPGEAGETARAIFTAIEKTDDIGGSRPVVVGSMEIGQVCVFDAGGEGAPWGPLGVTHAGLAVAAENLTHGRLDFLDSSVEWSCGMTTLGELFDIGPTHHLIGHLQGAEIIGAFEFFPVTNKADAIGTDRSLWAADAVTQRRLIVSPTHKGVPISDGKCDQMRARRSRLFYARNMRWTSQALLAATTVHNTMGGRAWTALQHNDRRVCKAFALWANSTFGMIVHWTRGQRTQAGRSTTQIRALGQIPCPRLNDLDSKILNNAATRFDELATRSLLPACQAHIDATRFDIDAAVIDMLSISHETLKMERNLPRGLHKATQSLRTLWCNEPSVHGQNKQALNLLTKSTW